VSKFQPLPAYQQPLIDGYQLLPFRFTLLDDHEYVLTNQAGEFIVLERPTLEALVHHQLPATDWLYDDLKSKHFIIDRDSSVAMDLLPLKVRTKLQRSPARRRARARAPITPRTNPMRPRQQAK
jgi:uncharacterized protein